MELNPDEIVGFALCISSILLYAYGSYSFYVLQYHMLSLPLFVSGYLLLIFDHKVFRESIFPIFFLLLLMPIPFDTLHKIGTEISFLTVKLSYGILKAFQLPVSLQIENALITIQNPAGEVTSFMIDVPCGGIYATLGFLVFAIFAAYITRGPFWKKGALFSVGFLLIYSLNILRVVVTVLMGYFLNSTIAVDFFHILGGPTLIFLGTIILLFVGQKAFKLEIMGHQHETSSCSYHNLDGKSDETFCHACGKLLKPLNNNLTKGHLIKFLAVLALVSLIASSQLSAFVLAGSSLEIDIRNPAGEETTQEFLPPIEEYESQFIYRDKYFETESGQDASLVFAYIPKKDGESPIWVTVEIADAMSKLHAWEVCLLFWQEKIGKEPVNAIELKDVQILENPPLIGRLFIFNPKRSNSTVCVLYWYERAVFNIASNWELRYMKTSLLVYLDDLTESEEYPKIENELLSIATDIAVSWEPVKTWSIFTPLFAKWAPTIIFSAITASLLVKLVFEMQKRKNKATLYKKVKLSSRFIEEDKKTLMIVEILRKHGKATDKEIFELYKKVSKESIDFNDFLEILKYAENEGLIERDIKNSRDEGLLVWKIAIFSRRFFHIGSNTTI